MFKYKDISEFNRRIVVESAAITYNAAGGEIKTWSTLVEVWAKTEQIGTSEINEKIEGQRISSIILMDFYIRYRTGITPKMRVKYNSKYYDIEAVTEIDNFMFTHIRSRLIE